MLKRNQFSLFAKVNEKVLHGASFVKLLALRKFYNPQTGVAEVQNKQKSDAINEFYETVWKSGPFTELIGYLRAKGKQFLMIKYR
jgi:hypothetical protein